MTKDEFINIMSRIDERLIDSTLDISNTEVAEPQYERPPVLRYVIGVAACIALLVTTVIAVPYFYGILRQPGNSSESSDNLPESSVSEFIRGWNPEELVYSEFDGFPDIGANVRVCAADLDGITVWLIMHNIIKRPGERHYIYYDDKYLDMWAADDICLYITDTEGNKVLLRVPTRLFDGAIKFFPNACLFENCVRLLKIEQDGADRYIIRMFLDEDHGVPIASYIDCDIEWYASNSSKDENGISVCSELRFVDPHDVDLFDWVTDEMAVVDP